MCVHTLHTCFTPHSFPRHALPRHSLAHHTRHIHVCLYHTTCASQPPLTHCGHHTVNMPTPMYAEIPRALQRHTPHYRHALYADIFHMLPDIHTSSTHTSIPQCTYMPGVHLCMHVCIHTHPGNHMSTAHWTADTHRTLCKKPWLVSCDLRKCLGETHPLCGSTVLQNSS